MKQAIAKSLDLLDYTFKKELKSIVIKINACYYWDYSTGQTTDPRFVASLIDLIRENTSPDIDISLIESDASAMRCNYAYKFLGFEKLAKDRKVRLINLREEEADSTQVMCDGRTFRFMVPRIISHADLRISLPKIKYTMEPIKLTCALKNIFGCNPYPQKYKYHPHLGHTIVALNKAMPFNLVIIDGNIVSGIQPRKLGLVMASRDPVSIDAVAAKIAGINPNSMKYLQLASREGVGNTAYTIRGLQIDPFKALYPRKTIKKKLMTHAFTLASRIGVTKKLGMG